MKEEFLHWVWKNRYFDSSTFPASGAGHIEVVDPGLYNTDSGPDFFNTHLIIDNTHWAGNTEVHINSSDWFRHGHHTDNAYNNVILHLVNNNDAEAYTASGRRLLTLELKFDNRLWDNYLMLVNSPTVIACADHLKETDQFYFSDWFRTLALRRLDRKTKEIETTLTNTGNDWEETLYRLVSRYFGFRVNTDTFELLASRLPLKIIKKHADNITQVEALLFGTAGLLDERLFRETVSDSYYNILCREFRTLSAKYSINSLDGWTWKFHRLRPANFPTLRISQLARLLTNADGLFSRVLECKNRDDMRVLFWVSASEYWDSHYNFGSVSRQVTKNTGKISLDLLLINAIVPLLYLYGKQKGTKKRCEQAIEILESLPAEDNRLIEDFVNAGIKPESAFKSQSFIELRNHFCKFHFCLECHIGAMIVSSGHEIRHSDSLFLEP
jgi:hypothetical protein